MVTMWLLYALSLFHVARSASLQRANTQAGRWKGQLPNPSIYESPRFRYWWPGGWIDPAVVKNEVQAIAAAGFGGAEIGDVRDSITVKMDPKVYAWAQNRWNDGVFAAYEAAGDLGLHMDYTLGPHWPTGVPGYTPESPETAKELIHGQAFLQAGAHYSGPLPLPVADPSGQTTGNPNVTATPQLVAVLAARTSTKNSNASVIALDHSTITDITKYHNNGTLKWTAPRDGRYILVAVYGRGTGQIQNMYDMNSDGPQLTNPSPAYIVDHLSIAGVEATVKYWDEHILTDELRALMKTSQGSLFEDSLELKLTQYWTPNFMHEFSTRRGYDLTPYLVYVVKDTNTFTGDTEVARMVEYDFYSTVTDLYLEYRLAHLKEFAHGLGLKLRVQPYTATFDSSRAAAVVDIPEGESLGFGSTPDSFRVLATGRDVAGQTTIMSNEIGAYMGKAYGDSPTSLWPGFAPFTPLGSSNNGFADAWGPRQPQWLFAPNASSYMARSQALLQSGSPSVDIAILNLDWGVTATWDDTSLNDAGYSYQFPTPELLAEHSASVHKGQLIHDGPRYKALVLNNVTALNVESAQRTLSYASAGLPIVVVGGIPSSPQSLCSACGDTSSKLKAIFRSILALRTTKQVASEGQVPLALQGLGVKPLIKYSITSNVSAVTTRRRLQDDEYAYWIYSSSRTSQTVYLEGEGYPLRLNLWTGEVSPIASFYSNNGYTAINLTIGQNAAEAIYFGRRNPYGIKNLGRHITSTNGEGIVDESGRLLVRATQNGKYAAQLSTGNSTTVTFQSIPPAVTPKSWTLTVDDWSPITVNETGLDSSLTDKATLPPVALTQLASWHNISGLEYASGVGVYQTKVDLSIHQVNKGQQALGVYLNIGNVQGSWGLEVNGQLVPGVDWFTSRPLDISSYIHVKITVATTLWNKLRKTWPSLYGALEPEETGLLGPVKFTYYAQQHVA